MDNLNRWKTYTDEDGIVCFIDPGTETKKKNRVRHVKDGCPKSERGKPKGHSRYIQEGKNGSQ